MRHTRRRAADRERRAAYERAVRQLDAEVAIMRAAERRQREERRLADAHRVGR
jgi:hypothetical protein